MAGALEQANISFDELLEFVEQHPDTIYQWIVWMRGQKAATQEQVAAVERSEDELREQQLEILKEHVKVHGVRFDEHCRGERRTMGSSLSADDFDRLQAAGSIPVWGRFEVSNLSHLVNVKTSDGQEYEVALSMGGKLGIIR